MKKKLLTLFIALLALSLSANADFEFSDGVDFTGESYFEPAGKTNYTESKKHVSNHTTPPLKVLRLKIQNKMDEKAAQKMEFAPTAMDSETTETPKTSKYASHDIVDEFEDVTPDGFEADEEAVAEKSRHKLFRGKKNRREAANEAKEDVILDCDNVDYDTPNYLIKASGNVNIEFVNQKAKVKCDLLTFDRINNTIKAEGNVVILKAGRTITGDYIFVDMNEENALIENPVTQSSSISIHSKKGYVYGDRMVQEDGQITVVDSYPIDFRSGRRGPNIAKMLTPKNQTLSDNLENGVFKLKADTIKITQKGDLEVIAIKKGKISRGNRTIFKIPRIKIYTNKNHDYYETNFWELGYYRGMGFYTGPGVVFELPKGSVLKAMPILNYNKGFGIGGVGRFSSGTNQTVVAYGSAASKFFVSGRQELDDKLYMQYAMNSYMDEWFLGRRRPKYGVSLVYDDSYSSKGFLIPNRTSSFSHRVEAGYFHNLDFDAHFERIKDAGNIGTTRFRYMALIQQSLLDYRDEDKLKAFSLDVSSRLSTALYGTGDTQIVGQIGPRASMQYKRWMQEIGYYFTAFDDNTPMARYDSYRYGTQYLHLREYFRICRWLTISWFANINTTNDARNGRKIQENAFYISVGPDDFKLHLGYDFERQILRAAFEVMMDAKGANVEYKTFELKQDKKAKKEVKPLNRKVQELEAPTKPKVLQRAVVENVKVTEDVL